MKTKIIFTILICIVISIVITSYNICYAASTLMTDANIKEAIDKYNSQADTAYTYEVSENIISRISTSGSRYDIIYNLTSDPVFTSTIEVNSQTKVSELAKINSDIMHLPFLGLYIEKVINGESVESAIEYAESATVGVPYGATISMTLNGDELSFMDGKTFKDGEYDITEFVDYVYDGVRTSYTDPDGAYSYTFNVNESSNSTSNNKSYVISLSLTVNENKSNQNNNQQTGGTQTNSENTHSSINTPNTTNTNISRVDSTTSTKTIPKTGISFFIKVFIVIALVALIIFKAKLNKYKGI